MIAQPITVASMGDVVGFSSTKATRNIYGFDRNIEVDGSPYADSTWKAGSFIFYPTKKSAGAKPDTINGFTMRYDVHRAEVDIIHKNSVFSATQDMVKGFFYKENIKAKSHYFVNLNDYKGDADDVKGFAEMLSDGKLKLFKYYYTSIKEPDYNPALGVGNKNYQLQHKYIYYYGKSKALRKLESTKLSSLCEAAFGDSSGKVYEYAKEQKLNTKKEEDLAKIFDFYNSLEMMNK